MLTESFLWQPRAWVRDACHLSRVAQSHWISGLLTEPKPVTCPIKSKERPVIYQLWSKIVPAPLISEKYFQATIPFRPAKLTLSHKFTKRWISRALASRSLSAALTSPASPSQADTRPICMTAPTQSLWEITSKIRHLSTLLPQNVGQRVTTSSIKITMTSAIMRSQSRF